MRIAVVCPYAIDRPGGVQGQAVQIVEWLREAGHESWLVAPGAAGGPEGTICLGRSVEVPLNGSIAPISLKPTLQRRMKRAVAEADVVHIHEPLIPVVSLFALSTETPPKVGTFHADTGRIASSVYWAVRPILRQLAGRLAAATAVSPVAAAAVADLVPSVDIVPNGLDVASFQLDIPRSRHRVLFIGRDEYRKGLDVLLEAWPAVRRTVPQAELVVLGAVRAPSDGVVFRGVVDDQEKRRALATSSVLVAPNLWGESFGLVIVEAMAAGCAIIASELPAFVHVLGDSGLFTPPGDAAALAAGITGVLLSDALRDRLMSTQHERVLDFDRHKVMANYVATYESVLGMPRKPSLAHLWQDASHAAPADNARGRS